MLNKRNILIGVTGGIAAYKIPELVRILRKNGADVKVILTNSASELVSAHTLKTLTSNMVYQKMFDTQTHDIDHISLARWADLLIIAPATANTMAKITHGIADNLLTSTVLSTEAEVLICPAMNTKMWEKGITARNVKDLVSWGYKLLGPETGDLACREEGAGRMVSPADIADHAEMILCAKPFAGKKITVTAGPTREFIDDIRFISNPSSGRMGFSLARWARNMGAETTLISGPVDIPFPPGLNAISVICASDMKRAVLETETEILIMCAAVCDLHPEKKEGKAEKASLAGTLNISLNDDIVKISKKEKNIYTVAFAAEHGLNIDRAKNKLAEKGADLIIMNDISNPEIGFNSQKNAVTMIDSAGVQKEIGKMSKHEIARVIMHFIAERTCT